MHNAGIEISAIDLILEAPRGIRPRSYMARALHAAIHDALNKPHSAIGKRIHDAPEKPIRMNPMLVWRQDHWHELVDLEVPPGATLGLRVTALDAEAVQTCDSALRHLWRSQKPLKLDHWPLFLQRIGVDILPPGLKPAMTTYSEILSNAHSDRDVRLRFTSPTIFRRGRNFVPLRQLAPRHILERYLFRWKLLANDSAFPLIRNQIDDLVTIRDHTLVLSRPLLTPAGRVCGLLGSVDLHVQGELSTARAVNALARFAEFCGTGSMTAWGFGQTEYLGGEVAVNLR